MQSNCSVKRTAYRRRLPQALDNMPSIFALILLFVPMATTAGADHCSGLVRADAAKAAAANSPGFRMPLSTDNLAEDVEYNISNRGSGCLGVARGDFDGNGKQDYLIALTSRTGPGVAIVVVLRRKNGWSVERLNELAEGRSRLFVEASPPGKYEMTQTLDVPLSEPGEVLAFTCKQSVAVFGATESSAVAYCRVGSSWQHVWISD